MRQRLLARVTSVRQSHLAHHPRPACLATTPTNPTDAGSSGRYDHLGTTRARSLIDSILPRSRFGSSVFTTPLLLFFRLFYQATPFDNGNVPSSLSASYATMRRLYFEASSAWTRSKPSGPAESFVNFGADSVSDITAKTSTNGWHSLLQSHDYPIQPTSTLHSMTWVKSLSAPLSHEYLQVVIECGESGKRYRLITERDTDGDSAYFIASSEECGPSQPSKKVTQLRQYDYQHDLPLPLISVSWSRLPYWNRPTAAHLATILEQVSILNPGYNVMREHCWWYAETVFERMFVSSSSKLPSAAHRRSGSDIVQPELKHWPAGAYRYSYILLGRRLLRRESLIEQAKAFRREMDEDGQIRW